MKDRIDYWYNRVDNLRILSKQLQLPTVGMTLDEHDMKDLLDILGEFRAVLEQEPKTGHWIAVTNGRGGHECSLCHEYAPSYQNGDEWITKYCPNCGAKMTEGS